MLISAIALYVVVVSALIGTYIHISTMDIQLSSYVQAPNPMLAGQPNAARGFILNAPTGRSFGQAQVELEVDGQILGRSKTAGHGFFHSQIRPEKTGVFPSIFRASHPYFETYEIPLELEVNAASARSDWPTHTSRLPPRKQGWRKKSSGFTGELEVDIFPENRELLRGLPNRIYLRVRRKDTGAPVKARVMLQAVEGQVVGKLKREYVTDAAGLAPLTIKPVGSQVWTTRVVSREPEQVLESGEGKLGLATVPSQFSMELETQIVPEGALIRGFATSLHQSGGLMVDLYNPHHWVAADAFGLSPSGGGFEIKVPQVGVSGTQIQRVQIYMSVFDAGNAWDSRYIAISNKTCPDVLKDVLQMLPSVDEARLGAWSRSLLEAGVVRPDMKREACKRWLEAALLAIPIHFEPPPQLINNQVDERESLEEWKEDAKSKLFVVILMAILLGFASILWAVALGYKASMQQRQAFLEVELELDDESSLDTMRVDQFMQVVRVVMLLITIVLFAAGVILVLSLL